MYNDEVHLQAAGESVANPGFTQKYLAMVCMYNDEVLYRRDLWMVKLSFFKSDFKSKTKKMLAMSIFKDKNLR